MRRHALLWTTIVLVVGALACTLSGSGGSHVDEKAVATQVSGTLTALAPTERVAPAPSVTSEPTDEPVPPSEAGGAAIVYIDDGQPWMLRHGETARQLSDVRNLFDVLISDDGARVVMLRRDPSDGPPPAEVLAVNADGSGQTSLLTPATFNALYDHEGFLHNDLGSIAFIPGSHDLLLNTRAVPEGPGLIKYDDLLRLDGETGELATLLPPGEGGDFLVSPDGSRVAVVKPDSIGLLDPDGSNSLPDLIPYEPVITYSEFQYYAQPVWSRDGLQLGVAIPSSDILDDDPRGEIWQVAKDGSDARSRGAFAGDFYFEQQRGGSLLSPTLDHVAFFRRTGDERIMVLSAIEEPVEQVYDRQVTRWNGWSPDGRHFIYGTGDPASAKRGAWGTDPIPMPSGTEYRWLSVDAFLYLTGERGDWTLSRGNLGGGTMTLVSPIAEFVQYDFAR